MIERNEDIVTFGCIWSDVLGLFHFDSFKCCAFRAHTRSILICEINENYLQRMKWLSPISIRLIISCSYLKSKQKRVLRFS